MRALVTGGGGFLGMALCKALLQRGFTVRSFSRGDYPEHQKLGIEAFKGDLADKDAVMRAMENVQIVFHAGAKAGLWGTWEDFYRPNVLGTKHVIAACRARKVKRLVFTSSPSVVFGGGDQEGVDESTPYPDKYEAYYPETKAMAERLVLEADDSDLGTVALRPHLIWGPGDNHIVPRLLERRRKGLLRKVGDGGKKVDAVYIDNCVDAHLLAADRLHPGTAVAGKAYFISNDEPWELWTLIDRLLEAGGLDPVDKSVPTSAAIAAGWILEGAWRLLGRKDEPRMTRFLANELSTAHWFDISAAKRDLGYAPKVSMDEGLKRLRSSLRKAEAAGV